MKMKKTLDGFDIKSDIAEKKKKEKIWSQKNRNSSKMRHTFTGTETQS